MGLDLGLSAGRTWRFDGGLMEGATFSGRHAFALRLGCSAMFPVAPFHIGGGFGIQWIGVMRATTGDFMYATAPEFHFVVLWDLAQWGGGVVFTGLRASVELLPGDPHDFQVEGTATLLGGMAWP